MIELKTVAAELEKILANPENPEKEVEAFLKFFIENNLLKMVKGDNVWADIARTALEFERYLPNVTLEDRLAGFFGNDRVLKLTKNTLSMITAATSTGRKR